MLYIDEVHIIYQESNKTKSKYENHTQITYEVKGHNLIIMYLFSRKTVIVLL